MGCSHLPGVSSRSRPLACSLLSGDRITFGGARTAALNGLPIINAKKSIYNFSLQIGQRDEATCLCPDAGTPVEARVRGGEGGDERGRNGNGKAPADATLAYDDPVTDGHGAPEADKPSSGSDGAREHQAQKAAADVVADAQKRSHPGDTRTQTILKDRHAGGGEGEKEDGHRREKAQQAAEKVAEERGDDGERRASSRKHKVVQRLVEEEVEGGARKRAKQGSLTPCAARGQDAAAGGMDIGKLSPEQAAGKLVGIVTIRKFFPRYGFFNGLITAFDPTTQKFQVAITPLILWLLFGVSSLNVLPCERVVWNTRGRMCL